MSDPEERSSRWRDLLNELLPGTLERLLRLVVKWPLSWPNQLRHLPRWQRSFRDDYSSLESEDPWLPYDLVERLDAFLTDESRVFEYGSGGSTLFFARRARTVTTVEHDREWYETVRAALRKRGLGNVKLVFEPPVASEATSTGDRRYRSNKSPYEDTSFETYVRTVQRLERASLDCLLIDGRARPDCIREGASYVAPGGWLIVDDAHRDRYRTALVALRDRWDEPRTFRGLTPRTDAPVPTALFVRPASS